MKKKIKAFGKWVEIKQEKQGKLLEYDDGDEPTAYATVLSVGHEVSKDVEVGDKIIYRRLTEQEFENYLLVKEENILVSIKD